jgi:N-dimethylarginine dimethylaminohydrolase
MLGTEILSLELASAWFYHLDTCFCPLKEEAAFYYPRAFDHYALKVLEEHIPTLIPVNDEEAHRFACNAVVLGNDVVVNEGCPDISRRLGELGFQVHATPLSEFIKAGGSAKCLVLKIPFR